MKRPSPFKLYKFLRGYEVKFHIGLPRRLCIWIAREYMFSRFWKIRWENIEKGLKESDHE